jgi:hypothetical protein
VAKPADAKDLKSFSPQGECGFKSHPGHHHLLLSLTLKSAAPRPPLTLEIGWFGRQPTRVINSDNNTDVAIARLDDHDLEARISGVADKLRINATISLHRDGAALLRK